VEASLTTVALSISVVRLASQPRSDAFTHATNSGSQPSVCLRKDLADLFFGVRHKGIERRACVVNLMRDSDFHVRCSALQCVAGAKLTNGAGEGGTIALHVQ
jgi:hypothetical protein